MFFNFMAAVTTTVILESKKVKCAHVSTFPHLIAMKGDGDGQGGLACCDSWGRKESDMTEQLN